MPCRCFNPPVTEYALPLGLTTAGSSPCTATLLHQVTEEASIKRPGVGNNEQKLAPSPLLPISPALPRSPLQVLPSLDQQQPNPAEVAHGSWSLLASSWQLWGRVELVTRSRAPGPCCAAWCQGEAQQPQDTNPLVSAAWTWPGSNSRLKYCSFSSGISFPG